MAALSQAGAPRVPPGRGSLAFAYDRIKHADGISEAVAGIFNCNSLVDVVEHDLEQLAILPAATRIEVARSTAQRMVRMCMILRDELARAARGIDAADDAASQAKLAALAEQVPA